MGLRQRLDMGSQHESLSVAFGNLSWGRVCRYLGSLFGSCFSWGSGDPRDPEPRRTENRSRICGKGASSLASISAKDNGCYRYPQCRCFVS